MQIPPEETRLQKPSFQTWQVNRATPWSKVKGSFVPSVGSSFLGKLGIRKKDHHLGGRSVTTTEAGK